MSSDNKKTTLIITVVTSGVLVILCLFYLKPQILMTDTAKRLTGKDFVNTENAIRENVLSVGGAVIILGTLWVSIVQTGILETQVSLEKEREWKSKVEPAYIEWAEAFLSATRQAIYIIRYRVNEDNQKKEEAERDYRRNHFIRQKVTLKILMFEQRKGKEETPVLDRFNEINKYPYPHYPITENIENKKQREEVSSLFWNTADRNDKIIGHFHGITEQRITRFCDWISSPDSEFEMPTFHDYLETVKTEIPALTSVIETILNKVPMSIKSSQKNTIKAD